MIVISDTSCISAFIQTGLTDLLPRLFGEVIVPEQVLHELQALSTFGVDVSWLSTYLLIMDERKGRQMAESLHLVYTGLGGVLIRAKAMGLIPAVKETLDRIEREADFFLSKSTREVILRAAGETV